MKTAYVILIIVVAVIAFFVIPPVVLAQVPPPQLPQDQGSISQAMLDKNDLILAELRKINANLEEIQEEEESNFIIAYRVDDAKIIL